MLRPHRIPVHQTLPDRLLPWSKNARSEHYDTHAAIACDMPTWYSVRSMLLMVCISLARGPSTKPQQNGLLCLLASATYWPCRLPTCYHRLRLAFPTVDRRTRERTLNQRPDVADPSFLMRSFPRVTRLGPGGTAVARTTALHMSAFDDNTVLFLRIDHFRGQSHTPCNRASLRVRVTAVSSRTCSKATRQALPGPDSDRAIGASFAGALRGVGTPASPAGDPYMNF